MPPKKSQFDSPDHPANIGALGEHLPTTPNSFTAVGPGRELPKPSSPRETAPTEDTPRLRQQHLDAVENRVQPPLGGRRPEGMSKQDFGWVTGMHHLFPNASTGPAINEPHEHDPHVTVMRRWEDLSPAERNKGITTAQAYGYGDKPVREMADVYGKHLERIAYEHNMAGVEETNSQLFYGGHGPTSKIPDKDLAKIHHDSVTDVPTKYREAGDRVAADPRFKARTPGLTDEQRREGARGMVIQTAADTSPQTKFREGNRYPNLEQAKASIDAALSGSGKVAHVAGYPANHEKARQHANEIMDRAHETGQIETHQYTSPTSPKVAPFRGNTADVTHTDTFHVEDVHAGHETFPGATTAKGQAYQKPGGEKIMYHPDEPASRIEGATQLMKKGKPEVGNSRVEEATSKGAGTIHAMADYTRRVAGAEYGISRGPNYSDNVGVQQAAGWGSEQVKRPDVNISHANQYPVVRNWAEEGHAELNDVGKRFFGKVGEPSGMKPNFVTNPNRRGIDRSGNGSQDVTFGKAYPVEPGDTIQHLQFNQDEAKAAAAKAKRAR